MAVAASWRDTERTYTLGRRDIPLVLVVVYVVALLALPNELGLHLGAFVLSPSRIILGLLVVAVLLAAPLRMRLLQLPKLILAGWVAFLASAAISLALNYSSQSLSRYGSLVAEGLALWALVWCIARGKRDATVLQVAIVATTTIVAATTLLFSALNIDYGDALRNLSLASPANGEVRFGIARQEGSFPAPLFFGTWLVGASMLVLGWLEDRRRVQRALAWAAWLILLAATIATVSRLAIVLDFAATGVYFLMRRRLWMGVLMLALAVVATLVVNGLISIPISWTWPWAAASAGPGGGSTTPPPLDQLHLSQSQAMRVELLQAAWPVLLQKPLFGWGLLNGSSVLTAHLGKPTFVDDTYLTFLVECGVLGVAALALLFVAAVRQSVRGLTLRGGPWSADRLPRLFAPAVMLAMMVFASFLSITQGFAAFVLLMTLATLDTRPEPAESTV